MVREEEKPETKDLGFKQVIYNLKTVPFVNVISIAQKKVMRPHPRLHSMMVRGKKKKRKRLNLRNRQIDLSASEEGLCKQR